MAFRVTAAPVTESISLRATNLLPVEVKIAFVVVLARRVGLHREERKSRCAPQELYLSASRLTPFPGGEMRRSGGLG
jgi:hypothetical protein